MDTRSHLNEDLLAALVEGRLPDADAAPAREHLAGCRSCMAAYAEAVRFQSIWLTEPETLSPTDELVRLGIAVGRGAEGIAGRTMPTRRRLAVLGLRPLALGVGCAALGLVAVSVWLHPAWLAGTADGDRDIVARVVRAAEQASAHGMVLPFGESFTVEDMTAYRSGAAPGDAELTGAIQALVEDYERDEATNREACLLVAGQIAAGQLGNARVFVAEARRERPDESCLVILDAIIAFRENDLDRAESLLRSVLQRDPGDLVAAFDLGLLLVESGRAAEAEPLLRSVQQSQLQSPIGSRAAALLEDGVPR